MSEKAVVGTFYVDYLPFSLLEILGLTALSQCQVLHVFLCGNFVSTGRVNILPDPIVQTDALKMYISSTILVQ